MAIEINGKIYRNLQEQVLKNKEDIEELKEGGGGDTPTEGVTEERVNELIDAAAILKDGSNAPTEDISWNDKGIVELGFIELDEQVLKPTDETDIWKDSASNVHVACPIVADFGLNSGGLPITNVGTPTNDTDAATKAYVDANAGGGGGITWVNLLSTIDTSSSGWCETGSVVEQGSFTQALYSPEMKILKIVWNVTGTVSTDEYGDKYFQVTFTGDTFSPTTFAYGQMYNRNYGNYFIYSAAGTLYGNNASSTINVGVGANGANPNATLSEDLIFILYTI